MSEKMTLDELIAVFERQQEGYDTYDGRRTGIGWAINRIRDNRAALEAGMAPPLRFRIVKAGTAMIWFARLIDSDGDNAECNAGTIHFMAHTKGEVREKVERFAKSLVLPAEFMEESDE